MLLFFLEATLPRFLPNCANDGRFNNDCLCKTNKILSKLEGGGAKGVKKELHTFSCS